jgi:3-deoxy-D-manno-octulosonate 8-phosphate phosphatase (KDO 8-P phosphatase)
VTALEAGLAERARALRLAIFDVDGVMTDGTLYIGAEGEAFKAFNILDGHGLKMLQAAGIATAIISGRSSEAVSRRAAELAIAHVVQGSQDKVADFERLTRALGIEPSACSYMGDDLPDLALMRRCGLAVAVANAVEAVKQAAHYVTRAHGGRGAVREFCDLALAARGQLGAASAV